jgi:hypothetical protein
LPDIQIKREHTLGLAEARKIAFKWAEMAEEKFDMECTYEEGKTEDLVTFTRSGVNGELRVTKDLFLNWTRGWAFCWARSRTASKARS